MKTAQLIVFLAFAVTAVAADSDYRTSLKRLHDRLNSLEMERLDYRKPRPELRPELDKERSLLIGQLVEADPVWALSKGLEADVSALAAATDRTAEDSDALESLKDLLALISGATEIAATREQALAIATQLRTFIVRRDAKGAGLWLKQQSK